MENINIPEAQDNLQIFYRYFGGTLGESLNETHLSGFYLPVMKFVETKRFQNTQTKGTVQHCTTLSTTLQMQRN